MDTYEQVMELWNWLYLNNGLKNWAVFLHADSYSIIAFFKLIKFCRMEPGFQLCFLVS